MNISGSTLPTMVTGGDGAEVYSAALAKKQQEIEGQAALALIESATSATQGVQSENTGVTSTLGNHINIRV
ncbi:hypothetical protein [Pseudoalteromonas sp. T1lg75]|uniref:hypothetical protein n=1 Tax=Pseudoalteromonas sp. T1lg75 TaxID=2077102 RepID=UPI000CF60B32|nr:hypothetical protein [Pseudoalteromonas sp. T1lg75]